MTQQTTAVAKRDQTSDLPSPLVSEKQRINRGDITVVQAVVRIPAHHQYKIAAGREQLENGKWGTKYRVGVTADGYDNINRVVGAQFIVPEYIHDEQGVKVRNPIHRSDYIYERMIAIWYNDLGQMQAYSEDLEVDYKVLYQQARLSATWKTEDPNAPEKRDRDGNTYREKVSHNATDNTVILRDDNGRAILGPDGTPQFDVVLPDDVEAKCIQRLYDLRVTGMRYAQTVLKNRLMKVVTGIRMLPIEAPRDFSINVMAFRDNLTPEQRVERAQLQQREVFGRALQPGATLSDEEMAAVELETEPGEVLEADLTAARNVTPDED